MKEVELVKQSWFGVIFKVLVIATILVVLHMQTFIQETLNKIDLSTLTTFSRVNFSNVMSNLNLVDMTEDKTSLLAWNTGGNDTTITTTQNTQQVDTEVKQNDKKIYIYNTHQHETYAGGGDVIEGANYLASKLEELGYTVIVEEADFNAYRDAIGLDTNEYYNVSKVFLEESLLKNGPYDLIIDFHRDAANKNVTTLTSNGTDYAKLMFVVGKLSSNATAVETTSYELTNEVEALLPGLMRSVFYRQSYYNQQVVSNMVLVEVGAQYNTMEEVKVSMDVFAQAIDNYLKED